MDSERGKNKISRDKLDQELRKAIEDASKCAKQQLGSVKEQVDSEIKATKERANTAADQVVQVQGDVLKLTVLVTALKVDGQTLKQEAAAACSTAEGLIKSLETLSDTLKALGKDMAQQKQEMITTRAHLHEALMLVSQGEERAVGRTTVCSSTGPGPRGSAPPNCLRSGSSGTTIHSTTPWSEARSRGTPHGYGLTTYHKVSAKQLNTESPAGSLRSGGADQPQLGRDGTHA